MCCWTLSADLQRMFVNCDYRLKPKVIDWALMRELQQTTMANGKLLLASLCNSIDRRDEEELTPMTCTLTGDSLDVLLSCRSPQHVSRILFCRAVPTDARCAHEVNCARPTGKLEQGQQGLQGRS